MPVAGISEVGTSHIVMNSHFTTILDHVLEENSPSLAKIAGNVSEKLWLTRDCRGTV